MPLQWRIVHVATTASARVAVEPGQTYRFRVQYPRQDGSMYCSGVTIPLTTSKATFNPASFPTAKTTALSSTQLLVEWQQHPQAGSLPPDQSFSYIIKAHPSSSPPDSLYSTHSTWATLKLDNSDEPTLSVEATGATQLVSSPENPVFFPFSYDFSGASTTVQSFTATEDTYVDSFDSNAHGSDPLLRLGFNVTRNSEGNFRTFNILLKFDVSSLTCVPAYARLRLETDIPSYQTISANMNLLSDWNAATASNNSFPVVADPNILAGQRPNPADTTDSVVILDGSLNIPVFRADQIINSWRTGGNNFGIQLSSPTTLEEVMTSAHRFHEVDLQ